MQICRTTECEQNLLQRISRVVQGTRGELQVMRHENRVRSKTSQRKKKKKMVHMCAYGTDVVFRAPEILTEFYY